MFLDEFGMSFRERLGRTWACRGQRPVIKRNDADRRALSTIAAVTISGHVYKRHVDGSVRSPHLIRMLKGLLQYMPQGFVLICADLGWRIDSSQQTDHRSKLTRDFLAQHPEIAIETLPPYAPELNAEEYCHGNAKQHLRNATPADKHTLRQQLDRQFKRIRRHPEMILGFFHAARLSVKQLW